MKDFTRGVSWYTKGFVEIGFPEDDICCHWCPMLAVDVKADRAWCRKTGEYLVAPKLFVGQMCPVKFELENGKDDTNVP